MKVLLADQTLTPLANDINEFLIKVKNTLLEHYQWREAKDADDADIILLNERWSYKGFRHQSVLLDDQFITKYYSKIIVINEDDYGTGYLKGLYTNISKEVIINGIHKAVPYFKYYNELVFENQTNKQPQYLAAWRGNPKSNISRRLLLNLYSQHPQIKVESTESWLNHDVSEKQHYVDLITNSKFSLCPAGWGPASFRVYESMALGRCPVIIADKFAEPEGVDWQSFIIQIPQKQIKFIEDILNERVSEYQNLGNLAKENWDKHFSNSILHNYYAKKITELSLSSSSLKEDIKRWNSMKNKKIHGWRLSDRILIKLRRITSN